MTPKIIAVLPARLASTRLPGKPLADIGGAPMIVRVCERVLAAGLTREQIYVATDHAEVHAACLAHQFQALMTRADHATGTDRLSEVAALLKLDDDAIIVNVQGDEPLIDPAIIMAVATLLQQSPDAAIATAAHPIDSVADFLNPNIVKVACNASGFAHYFSRAPIPFPRDANIAGALGSGDKLAVPALRHIGIYAYRAGFLKQFANLAPAPTESLEALEQLRALYYGYQIAVLKWPGALEGGVDTPEDLARVRAVFAAGGV
jgi:3-deoxy-manno-octulosonate cytidylyltransferase (CMP-KDO synthetase)